MNIVVKFNSWQHHLARFFKLHCEHTRVGTNTRDWVRIMTWGEFNRRHQEYVASVDRARRLRRQHGIN